MNIVLISTYELGRQPFGLASPAAWLREQGARVTCLDLSREALREAAVRGGPNCVLCADAYGDAAGSCAAAGGRWAEFSRAFVFLRAVRAGERGVLAAARR
jgi:hypothetical protein